MSAVSTHGGGGRVWCSRFDRTRSNGNFVHLLPERLATSRIWQHPEWGCLGCRWGHSIRLIITIIISYSGHDNGRVKLFGER